MAARSNETRRGEGAEGSWGHLHLGLQWTTSSGKRLRLGSGDVADGGGWGFAAGAERLWQPRISNGEKGAMGGVKHDLGTHLSKM